MTTPEVPIDVMNGDQGVQGWLTGAEQRLLDAGVRVGLTLSMNEKDMNKSERILSHVLQALEIIEYWDEEEAD